MGETHMKKKMRLKIMD